MDVNAVYEYIKYEMLMSLTYESFLLLVTT